MAQLSIATLIASLKEADGDHTYDATWTYSSSYTVVKSATSGKFFQGTSGNNVLIGGTTQETFKAGRGSDVIFGREGNDTINAGRGNDVVAGGAGNDVIYGKRGKDVIGGGTGDVQRNIVSERVLGLPHDVDVEQGRTWSEARRSSGA